MSSKHFCGAPLCELNSLCSVISPLFKGPLNNDNLITQLHIPNTQGRPVSPLCFSLASVIPNRDNCKETYCSQLCRLEVQYQVLASGKSVHAATPYDGRCHVARDHMNVRQACVTDLLPKILKSLHYPLNKAQLKTVAIKFPHELKRLS